MRYAIDKNKIKLARLQQGYSQIELANLIGVSSMVISSMELGKNIPRPKTLKKICSELKIDIKDVLV